MTIDPKSRNPLLADITKRIGLAERTGRGIDRIFEGTIRYGRPHPSYARTTATSVHLFIANAQPDLAFLDLLNAEEDKSGKPFPFESLVVMSALREGRHLLLPELSRQLQMPIDEARPVVEDLVERGVLESQGRGLERGYMLSANVYKHQGRDIEYVRLSGFTEIDHEQMVLKLARQKGFVRRSDVMELCHLSKDKAYKLLRDLCAKNELKKSGVRKNTTYRSVDCGA